MCRVFYVCIGCWVGTISNMSYNKRSRYFFPEKSQWSLVSHCTFLSDRIVHNSKLNSHPVPSPFFVTFVLFLLNSNPLSLRHPSNDTLLEHQAIMLPNLPHKHCLSKPMPLHAFLSFLLWPYVLAIVLALFWGPALVCLFAGKHSSCFPSWHVVFDAPATILKYILKYKVVVTSQHLVHVLINITVHLFKPHKLTGLVLTILVWDFF